MAHVASAKADGRWESAYDSPKDMVAPDDLLNAIAWRLQTAKRPETRKKRMDLILAMLKKGEKFH